MRIHVSTILVATLLLMSLSLSGCSGEDAAAQHHVAVAEASAMPAMVQAAPQRVAFAYRFAAGSPEVLQQMPCYCGCGPMGHTSNYACFWNESGQVDAHALGCGICIDIAEDAYRGLRQGRSLAEIRAQVDADYSRFGPPTDTAPVLAATVP